MVLGVLFRAARSAPNGFQDRLWKGGPGTGGGYGGGKGGNTATRLEWR